LIGTRRETERPQHAQREKEVEQNTERYTMREGKKI
jgi:hypothetical protein